MGNTTSFNNVTQIVETTGGLLLDANAFANMSTHRPRSLSFDTIWVSGSGDAPAGPYEVASSVTYENLLGRWSGPEQEDGTWSLTWSPEGSEEVKFTLVQWTDMSNGELAVFQHGFSACLKTRLDTPGAIPLSEDPILGEVLEEIQSGLEYY